MATQLSYLYEQIHEKYDIQLITNSCFGKTVEWIHTVDESEFAALLHGNELIFNSGIKKSSPNWLTQYVTAIYDAGASGLIMALKEGDSFPDEIITFCNEHHFPLFSTAWDVPFIDVMRIFSSILLKNEQIETNLASALKQAIYYPETEEMYLHHFEHDGLYRDFSYVITLISCHSYDSASGNEVLDRIDHDMHQRTRRLVSYKQEGLLVTLWSGYYAEYIKKEILNTLDNDPNVYAGIGTTVSNIREIYKSYNDAYTAYEITKTTIPKNVLAYSELGIYKILANVKDKEVSIGFAKEILGPLYDYDKEHDTDYLQILKAFFDNDCNVLNTSAALYCHKNTLNYKMKKIRELLGVEITENEHRFHIMMALHIMHLYNIE